MSFVIKILNSFFREEAFVLEAFVLEALVFVKILNQFFSVIFQHDLMTFWRSPFEDPLF